MRRDLDRKSRVFKVAYFKTKCFIGIQIGFVFLFLLVVYRAITISHEHTYPGIRLIGEAASNIVQNIVMFLVYLMLVKHSKKKLRGCGVTADFALSVSQTSNSKPTTDLVSPSSNSTKVSLTHSAIPDNSTRSIDGSSDGCVVDTTPPKIAISTNSTSSTESV